MRFFSNKKEVNNEKITYISPEKIIPDKNQPRKTFDEEELVQLAQSIKTHGIIQPIIVRPINGAYQIIAGERRWRASMKLGLPEIPVIIRDTDDLQTRFLAIIENLQREDLTSIEEARAFKALIDLYGLTQESLSQRLGIAQSTIGNKLRFLHLPEPVQQAILEKKVHDRQARALLTLKSEELQLKVMDEIITKNLNTRETESRVKELLKVEEVKPRPRMYRFSKDYRLALNTIRESFLLVTNNGLKLEVSEQENSDEFTFVIKVPKKNK
ncbi:ParB/RepB/Spo0J family partition protein [Paenibacillus sp. LMG 31458]|uniref:ParB/RepB/Spo0J family partition protein n=1 Tax=Paenibacillus phytorum TaxID=2654977 RepID=A0ABX1Y1P4_9BACL|nr:ParB/RepB/Spo0J family partition protein [Paenibacillus phytorum]NOU73985.1 ParB/RepB/Spo0J family partition protein [Paenibacillus phytorum]